MYRAGWQIKCVSYIHRHLLFLNPSLKTSFHHIKNLFLVGMMVKIEPISSCKNQVRKEESLSF
jgi:hypothetical protein